LRLRQLPAVHGYRHWNRRVLRAQHVVPTGGAACPAALLSVLSTANGLCSCRVVGEPERRPVATLLTWGANDTPTELRARWAIRCRSKTRTTFVWWLRQRSYRAGHFRAAPHAANGDSFAAPHAAYCALCAAPRAASRDPIAARRAAVDAIPYRTLPERWMLGRSAEPAVPERLAVPGLERLTSLARWSAWQSPTRRLVREGRGRLDARSFFDSCHYLLGPRPQSTTPILFGARHGSL
jgi:hypothetical protein